MPRVTARDKLVSAAETRIRLAGVSASTVDDICADAGVTKGSFYHHFASKDDLVLAVLDHYFLRVAAALSTTSEAPTARQRLRDNLMHIEEVCAGELLRDGCVLGILAMELGGRDSAIRSVVAQKFDQLSGGIEQLLSEALVEGGRSPQDATSWARQLLVALEGGIVLAKASGDQGRLVSAVRHFHRTLDLWMGLPS